MLNNHSTPVNNNESDSERYAQFIQTLLASGWEKYGENKERFLADPYYTLYGAQRFFMKEGGIHCVSITVNMRDRYGRANIIGLTEANIVRKKIITKTDAFLLQEITANDIDEVVREYSDLEIVDVTIFDKEYDIEYFMGFTGDMRAIFQSRDDDDRQKPNHETVRYYNLEDCKYDIRPRNPLTH